MRATLSMVASVVALASCGSSDDATPDAAPDGFPTAPHTAYPQIPDLGGPRLTHPQLITVTFAGDPRAADLEAYAQWIVGSSWLGAVGAEYGVGAGAVVGVAHRPETPPATLTSADIETYLADGVTDGSIPRPAPPLGLGDALYIVYYPATTSITTTFVNGIIKQSCTDFGGYHGEVHHAGLDFAYTAIPDCAGNISGLTHLETLELIVSHEVIEAATDAFPITAPAYQLRPDAADAWFEAFEFEVEVGDLCEAPSRYVREGDHVATRSWSNLGAAAGEPCVPVDPALPAFGVTATPVGTQHTTPGTGLDFTLRGWSTGPVADWKLSTRVGGNLRASASLGTTTINNDGSATMHVNISTIPPIGTRAVVFVMSQHDATDTTMWPVTIEVP